jgi:hypothetical protein
LNECKNTFVSPRMTLQTKTIFFLIFYPLDWTFHSRIFLCFHHWWTYHGNWSVKQIHQLASHEVSALTYFPQLTI